MGIGKVEWRERVAFWVFPVSMPHKAFNGYRLPCLLLKGLGFVSPVLELL